MVFTPDFGQTPSPFPATEPSAPPLDPATAPSPLDNPVHPPEAPPVNPENPMTSPDPNAPKPPEDPTVPSIDPVTPAKPPEDPKAPKPPENPEAPKTPEDPKPPQSPEEPAKPAQFDGDGNLVVETDDYRGYDKVLKTYTFRHPRGRDLATIQRSLKKEDLTDIEMLAAIVAALNTEKMTYDEALDLDAEVLLEVGGAITENFRVFSKKSV